MNCIKILLIGSFFCIGCLKPKSELPKVEISMFDYSEYEIFVDWSIWDRNDDLIVFNKIDSGEITNRFLIKYHKDGYLVFQSKLGDSTLKDSFVTYDSLDDSSKATISKKLIEDFYALPIARIDYRISDNNSYLIIHDEKGGIYWHFFSFDSASPPQLINNFDKIDSEWYVNPRVTPPSRLVIE